MLLTEYSLNVTINVTIKPPSEVTMANYIESNTDFENMVLKNDKTVLVDFYADWCGPCRALAPKLDELGQTYAENLEIVKVNVDNHQELAAKYGVRGIPAMFLFKDGEVKNQLVGNLPKDAIENSVKDIL